MYQKIHFSKSAKLNSQSTLNAKNLYKTNFRNQQFTTLTATNFLNVNPNTLNYSSFPKARNTSLLKQTKYSTFSPKLPTLILQRDYSQSPKSETPFPTKQELNETTTNTTTTTNPVATLNTQKEVSNSQKATTSTTEVVQTTQPGAIEKSIVFTKKIGAKIWHELVNLWNGSKLLAYEVKTATSILRRVINGHTLTRREKKQLLRTISDLFRLVPFVVILVVPFLEFALPLILKLFPNMLPSTFTDSMKKEEMKKQHLQVKLEVANFLQQVLHERARSIDPDSNKTAAEFAQLMEKVQQGANISNTEIVKFARFFEDEFTLDNLNREQLVAMCKYMQLNTIGTNGFLRYQLTNAVKKIKKDDLMIQNEGVESLTLAELQQACAARGLKGTSRSKYYLQERIREWLDLSLTRNLPISLLLLANAFKITAKISPKDALREALYHLPDSLLEEIKLKVSEAESAKNKLESLKKDEEHIKREEEEAKLSNKEIQKEQLLEWILQKQDIAQSSVTFTATQLKAITDAVGKLAAETTLEKEKKQIEELKAVLDKRKKEQLEREEELKLKKKLELEQQQQAEQLAEQQAQAEQLLQHELKLKKKLEVEQQQQEQVAQPSTQEQRIDEQIVEQKVAQKQAEVTAAEKDSTDAVHAETAETEVLKKKESEEEQKEEKEERVMKQEDKTITYLENILEKFVKEIEEDIKLTESSTVLNILDKDKDGVVSISELKEAAKLLKEQLPEEALTAVIDSLDADQDGMISLTELKPFAEKIEEEIINAKQIKAVEDLLSTSPSLPEVSSPSEKKE